MLTIGMVFWILMLISLFFSVYWDWPNHPVIGRNLLLWFLLFLLGWGVWGFPIKG